MRHGQRSEQKSVKNREDRRIDADSDGEGEDGDSGKAARFSQHPQPERNILQERFQPCSRPNRSDVLLYLLHATQLDSRSASCSFRRHSLRDVLFCLRFEVVRDFVIKFLLEFAPMQH